MISVDSRAATSTIRPGSLLPGKRLLIVDCEPALPGLAGFFQRLGCAVRSVGAPGEACSLIERDPYDLIILDLPPTPYGYKGLDLLRALGRATTPVMVLAAGSFPTSEAQALRPSTSLVLRKPQPPAILACRAQELLVRGLDRRGAEAC